MTKEEAFKYAEKFLLRNYGEEENFEYSAFAATKCAEKDSGWICKALEAFIDFEKEIIDTLKKKQEDMKKKKEENKHKYVLELTERQTKLLSWACDSIARIIEGQDRTWQDFLEQAWEKRCKEATGESMHKEWDGGWWKMRHDAEKMCNDMKLRFWGLSPNELYGIHYDDVADILWDIHQTLRHQLWLDTPSGERHNFTVDASDATQVGSEPLAIINRK